MDQHLSKPLWTMARHMLQDMFARVQVQDKARSMLSAECPWESTHVGKAFASRHTLKGNNCPWDVRSVSM